MTDDRPWALRARWIVPVAAPPLLDAVLTIAAGRILAVGENLSGQPPRDLGNVAVLPGLVNAHTHLQFSGLDAPLGRPRQGFAAWIREVVNTLRQPHAAGESDQAIAERRRADVARGLAESHAWGVTSLGDIATPPCPVDAYQNPGDLPTATVFLELLGLRASRVESLADAARQHWLLHQSAPAAWRPGWSPHAPYTANVELIRRVCQASAETQVPVAMHLAESIDEIELLQSHSGPLVELLTELDAWDPAAVPRGIRPADYLALLSQAGRSLVIHGNFLRPADWSFLAERRERMSVVYCPRTHDYFGHGQYPLVEMLSAGVAVAVGTDSRASSPDLNLLDELRFVRRRYPDLSPRAVLHLGTAAGAQALGRGEEVGALTVGRYADLACADLPDDGVTDVEDWLVSSDDLEIRVALHSGSHRCIPPVEAPDST